MTQPLYIHLLKRAVEVPHSLALRSRRNIPNSYPLSGGVHSIPTSASTLQPLAESLVRRDNHAITTSKPLNTHTQTIAREVGFKWLLPMNIDIESAQS